MEENKETHNDESSFTVQGIKEVSNQPNYSQDNVDNEAYYTVKVEDDTNLECSGGEIQASFTVSFNTDTNDLVESGSENFEANCQADNSNLTKHDAQYSIEISQAESHDAKTECERQTNKESFDANSEVEHSLVETFDTNSHIEGAHEVSTNEGHSCLSNSSNKEDEGLERSNETVQNDQVETASVQVYGNRNESHQDVTEENNVVRVASENNNISIEQDSENVEGNNNANVDNDENEESRHDEANIRDEKVEPDNDKTVNDSETAKESSEASYKRERKPRDWSKQEIQDLLIKAINFRSPVKDVKTIIRSGIDVNAPVKNGLHPLHYAAYCDNDESVEVLINAGANINATDDIGYTPLHLCARRGNYRTMKVLIENGSMINFNEPGVMIRNTEETNKLGFTTTEPLNLAVQNVHPKCAKLLLENGARPNNKYFMGYEICLAPLDEIECLELLLQHGADPNVFNRCGLSPLMKACKDHHIPAVRTLLKYGADVNAICPPLFEQKSVLQFAIMSGNIVIINILLQRGARVGRQGEYNFNALHTAVIKGRSDICRILLQYRAEPDETTAEGATALMLACATPELKERKEIVQLLIDCGANVNAFSPNYSFFDPYLSPLTEYLKNVEDTEDFNIVELLVRQGAEVHFSSSGLDRELRRLRDPYSILPYCHCLENFPHIFDTLVTLSNKYCPLLIHANEKLSESKKNILLYTATRPRELKHQIRVLLRQKLSPGLPENVDKLPLPAILKSYILMK